jgi:hypothetical protein
MKYRHFSVEEREEIQEMLRLRRHAISVMRLLLDAFGGECYTELDGSSITSLLGFDDIPEKVRRAQALHRAFVKARGLEWLDGHTLLGAISFIYAEGDWTQFPSPRWTTTKIFVVPPPNDLQFSPSVSVGADSVSVIWAHRVRKRPEGGEPFYNAGNQPAVGGDPLGLNRAVRGEDPRVVVIHMEDDGEEICSG